MNDIVLVFWISLASVVGYTALQFTFIASRTREPLMSWFALLCYASLTVLLLSIASLHPNDVAELIELDRWWYGATFIASIVMTRFVVLYAGHELKYLTYPIYGLFSLAFIANLIMPYGLFYASVSPELQFTVLAWGEQIPYLDIEGHPLSQIFYLAATALTIYCVYGSVVLFRDGRRFGAVIFAIFFVWRTFWTVHESMFYAFDVSWLTDIPLTNATDLLLLLLMAFELSNRTVSLINTEQSLQETESRYQHLIEYAGDGYFVVSAATMQLVEINQQASTMLGYTRDQLLQLNLTDISQNSDSDEQRMLFADLEPGTPITLEDTYICNDGSSFPVEVRAGVVTVAGERLLLAMVRDNTARVAVEAQRRLLENQIQHSQKLKALGTLSGGIAHDFNNILGAILSYTELALNEVRGRAPADEYVTNIRSAGLRARDLVKKILAFSRPSDAEIQIMPVDSILEEACVLLQAIIPSNIVIEKQFTENLSISADASQIHQVVVGLCTNAAQAMEQTGGTVLLKLEAVKLTDAQSAILSLPPSSENHVHLAVSDTGPGMEPAVMARAFEPFFTTKESGKGTGLGLSIAHGIIKHYGGAIHIESEIKKGTTVHIYLPRVESVDSSNSLSVDPICKGTEQILLVDDNVAILEATTIILRQLGYIVQPINSSRTALTLFSQDPGQYDLVITDLAMPELTGDALAASMREISQHIPVIMITGYSATIDSDRAKELGLDALLTKPVTRSVLAKTIREVLDNIDPERRNSRRLAGSIRSDSQAISSIGSN